MATAKCIGIGQVRNNYTSNAERLDVMYYVALFTICCTIMLVCFTPTVFVLFNYLLSNSVTLFRIAATNRLFLRCHREPGHPRASRHCVSPGARPLARGGARGVAQLAHVAHQDLLPRIVEKVQPVAARRGLQREDRR